MNFALNRHAVLLFAELAHYFTKAARQTGATWCFPAKNRPRACIVTCYCRSTKQTAGDNNAFAPRVCFPPRERLPHLLRGCARNAGPICVRRPWESTAIGAAASTCSGLPLLFYPPTAGDARVRSTLSLFSPTVTMRVCAIVASCHRFPRPKHMHARARVFLSDRRPLCAR